MTERRIEPGTLEGVKIDPRFHHTAAVQTAIKYLLAEGYQLLSPENIESQAKEDQRRANERAEELRKLKDSLEEVRGERSLFVDKYNRQTKNINVALVTLKVFLGDGYDDEGCPTGPLLSGPEIYDVIDALLNRESRS